MTRCILTNAIIMEKDGRYIKVSLPGENFWIKLHRTYTNDQYYKGRVDNALVNYPNLIGRVVYIPK